MQTKIAIGLLLCAGVALAGPATRPSHDRLPTTRQLLSDLQNDRGSEAPARSRGDRLPTTQQLLSDLQHDRAATPAKTRPATDIPNMAYIDLSAPVTEQEAAFSLFGDSSALTVRNLVNRLHAVRDDKNIRGVVLTFSNTGCNLAQAQEIRAALDEIRKVGKRSFVYADDFDTDTYIAASGATDICMLEGGEVEMPGVGIQTMFAKGLLDKVGVTADYVQIGKFKGADEEYTRTSASEELRGEMNKIVDSLYSQIVEGISVHRNLSTEAVKAIIDEAILSGKTAKDRGLVDHLVDRDGLRDLIKDELGRSFNTISDYGVEAHEKLDLSSPLALLQMLGRKPVVSDKPAVALIHADGVIVDGEAGASLFGGEGNIGSLDMRAAFRAAAEDPNIKAIVLRIDSPGGSALASEVMWQAASRAAAKKPLIVSVGSMAASGGYYLASSGDYIFADPSAIVGSIGVVGGKFVYKDLFDKLGLNTESFTRGRNADLFGSDQVFTDRQRRMVTNWMRQTYDQFTQRVMTHRAGKIKDITLVAQGRVFIAPQAKELGMIDELGGVDDAITYAANKAGLHAGRYEVRDVPAPKTLADILGALAGSDSDTLYPFGQGVSIAPDSILRAMPRDLRVQLRRQLQYMQLLNDRPVILVAPFTVTVR